MNIKVHTSIVLAACTATGLLLGWYLVSRYRAMDREVSEVGQASVALRNKDLLGETVGEWLRFNDLVLLHDESRILDVASGHGERVRGLLGELRVAPLASERHREIDRIEAVVRDIEKAVFESRDPIGEDRAERLADIAARAEPWTHQVLRDVEALSQALELRAAHRRTDLHEQWRSFFLVALLAAAIYFAVVWLCWIWIAQRVVLPIEDLSTAAARADREEAEFELPMAGPDEVRQLTSNISNFVGKLQQAKAGTEQQVRERTAQLVEANLAKGQFLATMSHELRTPLNGIINMNELILDTRLDEEQQGFARTAKSAAEALLALINDILDFSKIEAKKLDLECVTFDLREVVDSAIEILAGVAESKALDLQAIVEGDVPAKVGGDPTRLRQVLINLLNNALKFTAEGHVCIRVRRDGAEADDGGVMLRVEVQDTGIGIPEERRGSLFRAFEQVDSSTSRKYGGTGLGLAICRELATLMGGEIDVDSVVGEGSTFWFTVRLDVVEQAPEDVLPADTRVLILSQRETQIDRVTEQLRFLGVSAENIAVAARAEGLELPEGDWLALVDPYGREAGSAFDQVTVVDGLPGVVGERTAVLDHWMRHWPDDLGRPPRDVVRIADPVRLEALRDWVQGVTAVRGAGPPAVESAGGAAQQPPQEDSAPGSEGGAPERSAGCAGRVLVAEDTELNQRVICSILERGGYEAVVAGDGQLAVEAFSRETFDIVLMDCQMPEMDGLEATRRIRALETERCASSEEPERVPIIALTANAQVGFADECLDAGMDRFMSKPCRREPLLALMAELIEARRPRVPRILVADDDAINRRVAQSVLARAGYELELVEDGQQAVDAVAGGQFDLVLMDFQMPVLDGIGASRRIRELEAADAKGALATRTPIVALTGNTQDEDRLEAEAAGMDEFLTKPFRPQQLLEVVRRLAGPAAGG